MKDAYYDNPALYDAIYSDITQDIAVWEALARAAAGPVLEVCCGNGRVLLPLRRAGLDVDGLDLSPGMLAGLRERLLAAGLEAGVYAGDMASFAIPRRYALVFIAFNSFLHNLTQADQVATLRACREHLRPGGKLALAIFHPSAERLLALEGHDLLVKEIPDVTGPGRVRVHDSTRDDRVEQLRRVERRIEFLDRTGEVRRTESITFALRYIFKPEMELLLAAAGFAAWSARLLTEDRPLREGDMQLWTAWPEGAHA